MEKHPNEFAEEVLDSLTKKQKASLRESFIQLLEENPGKKQKGLLNAWHRLGAEWWDKKFDCEYPRQTPAQAGSLDSFISLSLNFSISHFSFLIFFGCFKVKYSVSFPLIAFLLPFVAAINSSERY